MILNGSDLKLNTIDHPKSERVRNSSRHCILSFYFQKTLTIFNSAFYGGAVMATGFDFFVENSKMLMWVWDRVRVRESDPLCWFSWAILATWPLTLLLGKQCLIISFLLIIHSVYRNVPFCSRILNK